MAGELTRREALQRAAWLLGGTLATPTILGVLAGCGDDRPRGGAQQRAWTPRTLTPDQRLMVVAIAEAIIPTTDTPGAKDAMVDQFVDAMLSDHYPKADRDRFLAGLARVDARAQRTHNQQFNALTPAQQSAVVADLDRLAFSDREKPAEEKKGPTDVSPRVKQGDVQVGQGTGADPAMAAAAQDDTEDVGPKSFYRMMKELAIVGYYTSEVGATRELRVNPMTRYRDIPYVAGTPTWA